MRHGEQVRVIRAALSCLERGQPDSAPHLSEVPTARYLDDGLFPNTIILVQPDHAMVVTVFPEDVTHTRFESGMLLAEAPASEKAERYWEKNRDIFWTAIAEDVERAESMQDTLASGANETLLFGRFEFMAARFHAAVDDALGPDVDWPRGVGAPASVR